MGQNVRKKNRWPPKADPGSRETPGTERDLRRSLRRRNVKYVFELDDYFDDDGVFDNDEDHRRKAKKLKLLLNLQSGGGGGDGEESTAPGWSCSRRVDYAPPNGSAPLPKNGSKPSKIRKIKNEIDEDINDQNDEASDGDNKENGEEVIEKKREPIAEYSPSEAPSGLPLPDKKVLELILNKLQKKDIYGVYAEPVDHQELPDYHDMIKHPMDFATVRNKLRIGLYETMEQFEHDIFLICSNAMQYNEPDTIYHKQAHSIKELAVKKFHKIRLEAECSGKDVKPDQKMRPGNGDVFVEGNYLLNDNLDDGEMRTGKGPLSRFFGTKSFVQDENRRATYSPSLAHSLDGSEPMFSTFEGESNQLVPVGLYLDHSYARSLARFAATLGSVAWKISSKRIEQAIPQGIKFGRGWVREYELFPTPVFILENCTVKEPPSFAKVQSAADYRKYENVAMVTFSSKEIPGTGPDLENKVPFLVPKAITPSAPSIIASLTFMDTNKESASEKPSLFSSPRIRPRGSANLSKQHQKSRSRTSVEPHKKIFKQFELTVPPTLHKPLEQGQAPSNPVQMMRVLAGNGRNQQISLNQSLIDASSEFLSSAPSLISNDSNLASFYAARGWMSVETGKFGLAEGNTNRLKNQICSNSPCNSTCDIQPQDFPYSGGLHIQPDRISSPSHAFVPQELVPVRVGTEIQFHNGRTFYPHLEGADMSRFPLQSTSGNLRRKLNIDFQSSVSAGAGRPSSGVLPDPALQLRQFI